MAVAISSKSNTDLFSETDFPNTTHVSDGTFASKVEKDQHLLKDRIESLSLEIERLTTKKMSLREEETILTTKIGTLMEDGINYTCEVEKLKAQIAITASNELDTKLNECEQRVTMTKRRRDAAEAELERIENERVAVTQQK